MTTVKINLDDPNGYSSAGAPWVTILPSDTSPVALTDINGDPTGWTIRWSDGFAPSNGGGGYNAVGVGDAAWVDDAEVLQHAVYHNSFASNDYSELIIEGPDELTIDAVGSYQDSTSHQDTEIWVNSETPQIILTYDSANSRGNNSDTASFPGVLKDGNNQFVIRFRENSGARGYLNGLQLTGPTGPSISVTQTELTPGGTISGSYADFETVPTTLTVSDGANTITIASPTINDNGDGTGTFSGTMPSLPTSGTADLILFGDVTVELS